jgi:phage tail sheath protein FI
MPVQTTYPGVYVQEVPSGVRTITGVSTSIAVFIGRTRQGPLNEPVLCLSISDFERRFSSDYARSDLARSVRLFFLNGGTQCYVMRVASNARQAITTLNNNAGTPVLTATAKSHGLAGNDIRLEVAYNTQFPESTFNLEIFRWVANSGGLLVKADLEKWSALSMDPESPRYAPLFISQNSKLIDLAGLPGASASATGFSQSGRPLRTDSAPNFRIDIGTALTANTSRFRISVNGGSYVNIDLATIDLTQSIANILGQIQTLINNNLPAATPVVVSNIAGPNTGVATSYIQISSTSGDVRIEPASSNDVARALILGTAQGGLEVSRFAAARPVPNGIVFNSSSLVSFAQQLQTAFQTINIGGMPTPLDLANTLQTAVAGSFMVRDGFNPSVTGNNDGIREKWGIIANAVNALRIRDPRFRWSAEVWGSRLALIAGEGGDNNQGTIVTSGGAGNVDIGGFFTPNVRYYSLGTSGTGTFQTGVQTGNDGVAPTLTEYSAAFPILDKEVDLFNLMILPVDADHNAATTASLWGPASIFCQQRRAFLLMDSLASWTTVQLATDPANGVNSLRIGLVKDHSAIFYPRVTIRENGINVHMGASGAIAGLMARTDANRGVWKAPAGTEADIRGITGIEYRFSDGENGVLNPQGINTIRIFPNGIVNWGARTMDGDDDFASEWKYIPVRRTALFIEESLYRGLKWVVFEPNDEPLWAQIRLNVGAFMHNLFRQGAFQGKVKNDAYFVKCDKETTTQNDINLGIVNIWVGFAPLKPAEFVILYLQQMTGQIQV